MTDKPQTPAQWAAYRCQTTCKIGREVLEKKMHAMTAPYVTDQAIHHLLHAIEDLSKQLEGSVKP